MNEGSNQARVAEYIRSHPEETYAVISRKLGIGYSTVARIAALFGIRRPSGKRLVLDESILGGGQDGNE
jgi:DNA-binding MurR/RpiR family transcriptional regulator